MSTFCSSRWGGKGVAQECIEMLPRYRLADRRVDGTVSCRALRCRIGILTRNSQPPSKHLALGSGNAPPDAQAFKQHR